MKNQTVFIFMCIVLCNWQFFLVANGDVSVQQRSPPRRLRLYRSNTTAPEPDHTGFSDNVEDITANSLMQMLHKINDRLTAVATVSDQQLRRLETFDYRLTKLEVQIQEKTDGLRTDLKEIGRRAQQLDWQSSKTESALDVLKTDTSYLKQAFEHLRMSTVHETNAGSNADIGLDNSNKLQAVLRNSANLLNSFGKLQMSVDILQRNVSTLFNSTRSLDTVLSQLLTTKHFQRSLLDLEKQLHRPGYMALSGVQSTDAATESESLPRDCSEVSGNKSSIYRIKPSLTSAPFFVYCDLQKSGGGWTVIQRRNEGTLEFYKGWHDYKHGFGNIGGEFWLGLEKIHLLTNYKVNEIYIELEDFSLKQKYAHYTAFAVGSEIEGYPITFLGSYEGTAGDSLIYHAGQKFSTFDMDHDNWAEGNCAQSHAGAWWYNGCDTSNLNGKYLNGELPEQYEFQGMYWYEFRGPKYSLKDVKIMIRPAKEQFISEVKSSQLTPVTPHDDDEDDYSGIFGHPND